MRCILRKKGSGIKPGTAQLRLLRPAAQRPPAVAVSTLLVRNRRFALLHQGFRRHTDLGLPATVLGVDAAIPTGALALYERAGMRGVERFTRWDRQARS